MKLILALLESNRLNATFRTNKIPKQIKIFAGEKNSMRPENSSVNVHSGFQWIDYGFLKIKEKGLEKCSIVNWMRAQWPADTLIIKRNIHNKCCENSAKVRSKIKNVGRWNNW